MAEIQSLVKLLERLRLTKDLKKEKDNREDDNNIEGSSMGFDLDTHLEENYDDYYDDYDQMKMESGIDYHKYLSYRNNILINAKHKGIMQTGYLNMLVVMNIVKIF